MRQPRSLRSWQSLALVALASALAACRSAPAPADLILHGGKVVTVDPEFTVASALAVRDGRIVRVGDDEAVLALRGPHTELVGLEGLTVLPGLIDSHTHPLGACLHEFDHEVPTMETIDDVLAYVRARAQVVPAGEWIVIRQVFITRLAERRYPTRAELDAAAPSHPVMFATGPDASLNSLALERSGIDHDFRVDDGGPGQVERDPTTGEPTGILRSCTRLVRTEPSSVARTATREDRLRRLTLLLDDYASVGITAIADRNASAEAAEIYAELRARDELPVRVFLSRAVDAQAPIDEAVAAIRAIAQEPLRADGDERLRVGGVKVFLDGGMLTGSAYMREPWGA